MLRTLTVSARVYDSQGADLDIQLAFGPGPRAVRIFLDLIRISGTNPTIRVGLYEITDSTHSNPMAIGNSFSTTGSGILLLEFPPASAHLFFDLGGTTPVWTISYIVQTVFDEPD